jgi:hypothetical protein
MNTAAQTLVSHVSPCISGSPRAEVAVVCQIEADRPKATPPRTASNPILSSSPPAAHPKVGTTPRKRARSPPQSPEYVPGSACSWDNYPDQSVPASPPAHHVGCPRPPGEGKSRTAYKHREFKRIRAELDWYKRQGNTVPVPCAVSVPKPMPMPMPMPRFVPPSPVAPAFPSQFGVGRRTPPRFQSRKPFVVTQTRFLSQAAPLQSVPRWRQANAPGRRPPSQGQAPHRR